MKETARNSELETASADDVDVVVIGGGAAGLNGALMLARSRRSVIVIDSGSPRNAPAEGIHGLLGREGMRPLELLRLGRTEIEGYGGRIVHGSVDGVTATDDSDLTSYTVTLADGSRLQARRLLIATGITDVLPAIPGLRENWGRGVVHCPYCHGWEVRDRAVGVLMTGPASVHQALLFRQLTDDLTLFTNAHELDADSRLRLAARVVRVVESPVAAVESDDSGVTGVRLADGSIVEREAIAVSSFAEPRVEGLDGLGLTLEDLPGGMGRRVLSGQAGSTEVPGVWVAGNVTDPMAQVGASAAAGAMAGAQINYDLVMEETEAALAVFELQP